MSEVLKRVKIGDLTLSGHTYKDCEARFYKYAFGDLAIVIYNEEDSTPVCTATVNVGVPGVFIKDYSENEGLLAQLVEKGLVKETGSKVHSGYVEIPEVSLQGAFAEAAIPREDRPGSVRISEVTS